MNSYIKENCQKLIEKPPSFFSYNSSFVTMNLKGVSVNYDWNSKMNRRFRFTERFVIDNTGDIGKNSSVLDTGGSGGNSFGRKMAEKIGLNYMFTVGDMNYPKWSHQKEKFDVIFCFEVLEHLMNPLLFLGEIKARCNKDAKIFITFPNNPLFLWSDRHFQEYTKSRFYTLISEAGYRIESYAWDRDFLPWKQLFTGVRPLVRTCFKLLGLSRGLFFCLRLK